MTVRSTDPAPAGVAPRRRVGVLGGMGPAATVDLLAKIVEETPARSDQDHVPVVVWGDPRVPDRSTALTSGGQDPTPWLQEGIAALASCGCELLAVACTTAHPFVRPLAATTEMELVDLVDVAARHVVTAGHRAAGLLATTGTLRSGLHAEALAREGVRVVEPAPAAQERVMRLIAAVKAGRAGAAEAADLAEVRADLERQGAGCVVAACTEIVLGAGAGAADLVDPARLLAREVVARSALATGEPRGW